MFIMQRFGRDNATYRGGEVIGGRDEDSSRRNLEAVDSDRKKRRHDE